MAESKSREDRAIDVFTAYLEAQRNDPQTSFRSFLDQHSDLRDLLQAMHRGHEQAERAVASLTPMQADDPRLPLDGVPSAFVPDGSGMTRRPLVLRRWVPAAAAAVLLCGYLLWRPTEPVPKVSFEVACSPGAPSLEVFHGIVGLPHDKRQDLRTDGLSDEEYRRELLAAAQRQHDRHLMQRKSSTRGGHFFVTFQSSVECSAIVLLIEADGNVEWLYPTANHHGIDNRFRPDQSHVLPSDDSDPLGPGKSFGYEADLTHGSARVLIALTTQEITAKLYERISEQLADSAQNSDWQDISEKKLSAWFEKEGFTVDYLDVFAN